MRLEGLILIYTGSGKGKTTAALGLALRFLGHGFKVCLIQFVKDERIKTGERQSLSRFYPQLEAYCLGKGFIFNKNEPSQLQAARSAWEFAKELILLGHHDLIILDEIGCLLGLGIISEEEVLEVLEARPRKLNILLTGRDIPATLWAKADLVTKMQEVKHPYQCGIKNIKGIDY